MKKHLLLLMCLTLLLSAGPNLAAPFQEQATTAQEGKKMSFQGTLYENGAPVTGERSFTFSIDLGEGKSWTETQANVQVIEGLYAVTLGSVNPMPTDLFFDVAERTLTVSIGNNVLGSTNLYAPFSDSDNQNFGRGMFQLETMTIADSTALVGEIYGIGNNGPYAAGVRGLARTDTTSNTGVSGIAYGGPDNKAFNTAVRGDSYANTPESWSTGVWGIGNANAGGISYGVRGEARGNGSTFSAAMRGLNFVEPGDNGIRYGGYFNTYSSTTQGTIYTGESIGVRGNGGGSDMNTGLIGEGFGPGYMNIGVKGTAYGADVNWAGWFEGDVAVRNGGNLNLYGPAEEDSIKVQLNYYDPNQSGSVLTFGHNKTRRILLGSTSDRTGGLVHVYDSLDRAMAQLRASARSGDWVSDKQPHGQLSLWGPGGQNFYLGARVWEENGSNAPVFQMFGKPVETVNPDTEEVFTSTPEGIYMTVQDFGDGAQQGMIQLGKEGQNAAILNFDNLSKMVGSVDGNGKYRFGVNEQNSGTLKLMSAVDSVNVLIDSNGEKAGLIHLNDSLGRANLRLLTYAGGGSYLEQHAGIPDIGETRVTYQLVGNANPWTNMIARNADGTAKGRVQSGWLPGGGEEIGQFRISSAANNTLVSIHGNEALGGRLALEGPNSSNFFMGGKEWENSDLPFFAMRGATAVDDGNGGTYFPDILTLNISQKDGQDYASLDMSNSNLSSINLGVKSWENNGLKKPIFQMMSDYETSDGNGGTYRPSLIDAQINISDANTYSGDFNLNSSVGTGIRMYGATDFNNNGTDVYSHIALDGLNDNHIYLDGNGNGDFTGNISAVSVNQTSDARLKKNVSTLTSGLAMVNRLRGVRYNWKDESKPESKIGFIAQEVEEILPELVMTKEDGYKAVNYSEITAVLVEAVKELSAQVEALKAENNTLKAEASKVETMEDRLAKIEALLLNNQKVNANQK